jgi:hypothetical protein
MKHRGVDKDDIVNREIVGLLKAEETSTVSLAVLMVFVTETWDRVSIRIDRYEAASLRTLYSAFASATEHLKIVCVPDEQHIARLSARTVDYTIKLKSPSLTALKGDPSLHGIVSGWHNDSTTSLACRESFQKRRTKISRLVRLCTIVENVASLLSGFGGVCGKRSDFA